MKIGILTFHYAINYGAILQTYASYRLLKDAGYDVEIIDYRNRMIENDYKTFEFSIRRLFSYHIKSILLGLLGPMFYQKRKRKFNEFIKLNFKLSPATYLSPVTSIPGYDVYIIGSDQVWNTHITHGFDNIYWGNFSKKKMSKTIGWSVSTNEINKDLKNDFLLRLANFSLVSTRERQLKLFIESISEKEIALTLDPTLVLEAEKWKELCVNIRERKYVLVFAIMGSEDYVYHYAKSFANKHGLKMVILKAFSDGKIMHHEKQCCGPNEFLSYIFNAEYVLTSSFHGTAFSLIFEKQFFCVFDINEKNIRIESLLAELDMSDRIVREGEFVSSIIDYRLVTPRLKEMAKVSKTYLFNSLIYKL